jgi:hypothetical protein
LPVDGGLEVDGDDVARKPVALLRSGVENDLRKIKNEKKKFFQSKMLASGGSAVGSTIGMAS